MAQADRLSVIAGAASSTDDIPSAAAVAAARLSVLLVEDTLVEAQLVCEALAFARNPRIDTRHAARIADALEALANEVFDVVVLDLGLPDADGLDGLRRIQEAAPNAAIVVRSGLGDERVAVQALAAGAHEYIVKGGAISGEELLKRSEHERSERAREQAVRELRDAQALAGVGSWTWDPAIGVATWSEEMYRIFGRDPVHGPAIGERYFDYVHPDDRSLAMTARTQGSTTGVAFELDHRIIAGDGTIRTVHSIGRSDPDRPGLYVGTVQDVTELRATERQLAQQRELLARVLEDAPIGMALVAPDGRWLKVNRALCEIVGYEEAELLELSFQDLTHPDDLEADLEHVRRMLAGEIGSYEIEKRYLRKDGRIVWIKLSVTLMRDEQHRPLQFISQIQDITAPKESELALQRERDHSEAIVAAMSEGYALTVTGQLVAVNDALCEITGFSREELEGAQAPFPFWPPEAQERYTLVRDAVLADGGGTFELTLMRKDGSRFPAEITTRPAHNPDGSLLGYVNTLRDVSERKRHEAELERRATHDGLTGLANHRMFHQRLGEEIARATRHGRPLSVAVLDLDRFKQVNDRHGHLVGDRVLREVASRLAGLVREEELVARVGGEEFAWILPDATAPGALAAAERARRAICEQPIDVAAGTVTLSAGVCDLACAASADDLYDRADQALYEAKRRGRNQVCCCSQVEPDLARER
jgi:diguanylate cyclase (GGDEF)-like protein/PAS domain S-box-containing protein